MKKIICAIAGLLVSNAAHAQGCTPSENAVADAQAELQTVQAGYKQGTETHYDVLFAQNHVLKLDLCVNPNKYASYKALADNVSERLALAQASYKAGVGSLMDVILVASEASGMAQECPVLLTAVKQNVQSGTDTLTDLRIVQSACDELKAK